jgi:hypothetical protein
MLHKSHALEITAQNTILIWMKEWQWKETAGDYDIVSNSAPVHIDIKKCWSLNPEKDKTNYKENFMIKFLSKQKGIDYFLNIA